MISWRLDFFPLQTRGKHIFGIKAEVYRKTKRREKEPDRESAYICALGPRSDSYGFPSLIQKASLLTPIGPSWRKIELYTQEDCSQTGLRSGTTIVHCSEAKSLAECSVGSHSACLPLEMNSTDVSFCVLVCGMRDTKPAGVATFA